MGNKWMKKAGIAFSALALMTVTACGGQSQTAAGEEQGKTNTSSAQAQELTVYLNDFDAVIGDMFEKKTGIKLNIVSGNGAEILSRIEAEKSNPQWDVVWIDAMPSIYGLDANGQLLQGWTPDNAAGLKEAYKAVIPKDGAYYPTGAHAAGIIVYNKDKVSEEQAPKTWEDLKKDAFKGRVGMADPAVAAPAYPFVSWFFNQQGMEGGQAYFDSLMKQGLHVYPKNPQVVQAMTSGEIDVAALQESNAYSMLADGEPVKLVWPEEGAPASVRVAAIQKDSDQIEAAKEFVNFLLDPQVQQQLVDEGDESYFEPSAEGAKPKPERDPNAKLNIADAAWASEHEAEIKQWFADQSVQ